MFRKYVFTHGTTQISGVTGQSVDGGEQTLRPLTDGLPDPTHLGIIAKNARLGVSTHDLAALLAITGVKGALGAVTAYDALMDGAALSASGATKYYAATAWTLPRTIAVGQDGLAVMAAESIPYGTAMAKTTGQALPEFVTAAAKKYSLGPLKIGATQITSLQDINVNFGLSEDIDRGDGGIVPIRVNVSACLPVITGSTLNAAMLANFDVAISSSIVVYFRKLAADGAGFVADNVAEHISITIASGRIIFGATSGDKRLIGFRIEPRRATGSTPAEQMVISTATTIT